MIGASSIAHDITAQRRSEEALRRNEKLATAGRLAAAVAHEINNPLDAVNNLIYLARHHPEKQDHYLGMAEKEVLRVGAIAQQMLGFVRESSSPSPLNVAATLDDVLLLYMRQLNDKHIHIDKMYRRHCRDPRLCRRTPPAFLQPDSQRSRCPRRWAAI